MTKSLYIANCRSFAGCKRRQIWTGIYSVVGFNVSLVDRTERLRLPFRFDLYEPFRLPTDLRGFTDTYEDCCNGRAKEIVAIQQREQVPIALLYSGGIDSTLVLVSFAKLLGAELKDG
jgi:asparagine synthetase B (glutamine-hydrolysing)